MFSCVGRPRPWTFSTPPPPYTHTHSPTHPPTPFQNKGAGSADGGPDSRYRLSHIRVRRVKGPRCTQGPPPTPPPTPCSFDPAVPRLPDEELLRGAARPVRRGRVCVRRIPEDDPLAGRGASDSSRPLGLPLLVNAAERVAKERRNVSPCSLGKPSGLSLFKTRDNR